jgi:tetratricopeptide (TPR) repeat protein
MENSWVSLQILQSPPRANLMMVSPWDYKERVPSFENEAVNFVDVVVVQHGERAALESGTVLKALASQINKANAPKSADKQTAPPDPKANLEAVAKQYGYTGEELDKAIRAWGAKTTDPYEAGLAALYARNYDKATTDLQTSLSQREEKLASDQKAVADAAFFLGMSLYEQGKYYEAAAKFQRSLQIQPDDAAVINNTATTLHRAGDYEAAEPLFRRALAIAEKALGPDHPDIATCLNNLASLLQAKGDYVGAEPFFRRALAINEHVLGPDDADVAMSLNNLALLLQAKGDYAAAEPLYQRALATDEKTLGPNHQDVAMILNNLASLLQAKGDYVGAEPFFRRALAIDEKVLGPDHPEVATDLNNLASLLYDKGDYAAAEPLMRRAVAIDEKALGPNHPDTRFYKKNLNDLLQEAAQATEPKAKN